ncbi:hypothetical protein D3C71_1581970 [compost metagenome]
MTNCYRNVLGHILCVEIRVVQVALITKINITTYRIYNLGDHRIRMSIQRTINMSKSYFITEPIFNSKKPAIASEVGLFLVLICEHIT